VLSPKEDEGIPEADVEFTGNEFVNLMDSGVRHMLHERWENSTRI
jgi:hypothetical protein